MPQIATVGLVMGFGTTARLEPRKNLPKRGRENVMFLRGAVHPSERFMAAKRGVNRRLEFELGAWFEGFCGFALVLALSHMLG